MFVITFLRLGFKLFLLLLNFFLLLLLILFLPLTVILFHGLIFDLFLDSGLLSLPLLLLFPFSAFTLFPLTPFFLGLFFPMFATKEKNKLVSRVKRRLLKKQCKPMTY